MNQYAALALQAAQWRLPTQAQGFTDANSVVSQGVALSKPVQKKQFPPVFETNGGMYQFQTHTGCFYEPSSQYYYNPKSKLYYSTSSGIYYGYDRDSNRFENFMPPLPPANELMMPNANDIVSNPTDISIPVSACVITNQVLLNDTNSNADPSSSNSSRKPIVMNMSKKNANRKGYVKEIKKSILDENVDKDATAVKEVDTAEAPTSSSTTATAPVICTICQRKFVTNEQYMRHVRESKLHAVNVAKLSV